MLQGARVNRVRIVDTNKMKIRKSLYLIHSAPMQLSYINRLAFQACIYAKRAYMKIFYADEGSCNTITTKLLHIFTILNPLYYQKKLRVLL